MSRLPVEGETFGRYRLLRRLGHGGMGVVYAALDSTLEREVALKLVAPHLADDPEFRARFAREATVLARMDSPRAVRIYDHGEHDGVLYIATQLIEGGDLAAVLRESGALSPALAVDVVCQVLEGLGDAHAVGVTHRDIKPANVLVRQRAGEVEAFLCDFGIATTAGAELSRTGTVAGSLPYMAPERHQGHDPGPAGDVYSAGCLLWFALVGSAPYVGTDVEVAIGHIQGAVPQLPGKDEFSKRVNAVLARAMSKETRKRYPGAGAMLADLRALAPAAPGAIALPGATAIRQAIVAPRRTWRPAMLAVVAVLSVVGTSLAIRLAATGGETPTTLETEVTRTVSAPPAPSVAGQHTLLPPATRSRGATQQPQQPQAPQAPAQPVQTRTATAPARSVWDCWNGTASYSYFGCGEPRGLTGRAWVFPEFHALDCPVQAVGSPEILEAWACYPQRSDGTQPGVGAYRWTSSQAARDFYLRWFSPTGRKVTPWYVDGQRAGVRITGMNAARTHHGIALVYADGPFSTSGSGTTLESTRWVMAATDGYRPPDELRGERR